MDKQYTTVINNSKDKIVVLCRTYWEDNGVSCVSCNNGFNLRYQEPDYKLYS